MRCHALAVLILLAGCDRGSPEAAGTPDQPAWGGPQAGKAEARGRLDRTHAGTPAPTAPFEDPEGEPTSLAEFTGKPVLLNLWATWCGPCVAEMPTLDALAAREKGGLQVLTVSQDLDGRKKVEAFFTKQGYRHLETWLDPKMELMTALKVDTLPTTILYDSAGREVWRVTGIDDWQSEGAAALIAESSPSAAR
jgi:thiol-disulfide isomerase/thioredoxin